MFHVDLLQDGGATRRFSCDGDAIVGRGARCDVRLESWRVSREHARLYRTPSGVVVEDLGSMSGVVVNGQRSAHYGPLRPEDRITVGPFVLTVLDPELPVADAAEPSAQPTPAPPMQPAASVEPAVDESAPRKLEFHWRRRVHEKLLETLDLRRRDVSRMSDQELRTETEGLIREIIDNFGSELPRELDREALCQQSVNEAIGLGPLEELLADESVTEVMVNRHDEVFVERGGRLQRHPVSFTSDHTVLGVIERIVAPLGRRIDESSPMVDARLKDGSRVNAIIPPLALKGPTITIRKFAKRRLTDADLVNFGALSYPMANFLKICVEQRKTTLLNILSNFIPEGERILTIEDAAELRLHHPHLVSLEARPANVEGRGQVAIRDLVRNALRMRPDRIVVGECRGPEALDMLQAMNTGHEGSLTTLHANTPRDALARLETMVLMAGMDLPLAAIREQIGSAVDIIVQQSRFSCGARKVTRIVELTGMEGGKIQLQELFRYERTGVDARGHTAGHFCGAETVPSFYEELVSAGVDVDLSLFSSAAA